MDNRVCGFLRGKLILAAVVLAALSGLPARADEDAARPSPRTAVEIGGASVVLVAANDRIYAFVDRLEDNAPETDAVLAVSLADGTSLKPKRVADGMYVAPFTHAGHMQDAFLVSLVSPDGAGDAAAEIAYGGEGTPEVPAPQVDLRGNAAIALVAGAIGAAMATSAMLLTRNRRRRAAQLGGSALAA
jgi:hypothetical protein